MDSKEYISSGILESYALGLCSVEEAAEAERMCLQYPEVREELLAVQSALEGYARAHAQDPAAETKDKLFARIGFHDPSQREHKGVISLSRYLVAASIVLVAFSLLANFILFRKWRDASQQVIALSNEKNVLADNLETSRVKLNQLNESMGIVADPGITRVMMKGLPKSPGSMAVVYWNKQDSRVYLEVKSLPAPQPGMQYQLWAIVDGKPVDAGMLSLEDTSGVHRMRDFETAQAFAITMEKAGGSPVPTMDEMVVMGTTSI